MFVNNIKLVTKSLKKTGTGESSIAITVGRAI